MYIEELREKGYLKDLDIDGSVILKWIFKKWDGETDWVQMAQDRNRY
jgi:hypothetical protein